MVYDMISHVALECHLDDHLTQVLQRSLLTDPELSVAIYYSRP